MKVWVLLLHYSDGYTYSNDEFVGVFLSEVDAIGAAVKHQADMSKLDRYFDRTLDHYIFREVEVGKVEVEGLLSTTCFEE